MNLSVIVLGLALLSRPDPVIPGTKDSGGDAHAQQFIDLGKKLSIFLQREADQSPAPFKLSDFNEAIDRLDLSIKDEGLKDLIEFTDDVLRDKDGVEKPAIFNPELGSIRVNRASWNQFSIEERLIEVVMEVSGLMKVPTRYEAATRLIEGKGDEIAATELARGYRYPGPSRRMVGMDPGIFSDITEDDILIDGGVMGSGSELTKRMVSFLQDPATDDEISAKMFPAWEKGRRAFIIFHSQDGDFAVLASIAMGSYKSPYDSDVGAKLEIYSLLFERSRQIWNGPCAFDAPTLTSLQRIKRCYLDLNTYSSQEDVQSEEFKKGVTQDQVVKGFEKVFSGLYKALVFHFALNEVALNTVLKSRLIPDYSMVDLSGSGLMIKEASARAHQLQPTLVGPFDAAPFWKKAKDEKAPLRAVRLYQAARIMAEHGLIYEDCNFSCPALNKTHGPIRGPLVIEKDLYDLYVEANQCAWTRMWCGFTEYFYDSLVRRGFWYDPVGSQWKLERLIPLEASMVKEGEDE